MKIDSLYLSTFVASVILCGLCLLLPVWQWASIPDVLALKVLAGLAAFSLSICKLTFIPISIRCWPDKKQTSVLLIVAAFFALAISVNATRDLLETITFKKQELENSQSLRFKNAMREAETLNKEIETLNTLLKIDADNNYRDRAYKNHEKLEKLKLERKELFASMESTVQTSLASSSVEFGRDLDVGVGSKKIKIKDSTGAAILLHVICVLSVVGLGAIKPKERTKKTQSNDAGATKNSKKPVQKEKIAVLEIDGLSEAQLELAKRIEQGEFGNTPILRKLIQEKVISGGHKKIKPVFTYLVSQNKMIDKGTGFELVQQTLEG